MSLFLMYALPAQAETPPPHFYKYLQNEAEYSVMLPEAPRVETLWGDAGNVPYLDHPPKDGNLGEIATFRRVDMETDEYFDVHITFLKADHDFLAGLTKEKMQATLEKDFKKIKLTDSKFDFTANPDNTLKRSILTGFSLSQDTRPLYNVAHYLTGRRSILVVKVQYSVENETFANDYQKLINTITFHAM